MASVEGVCPRCGTFAPPAPDQFRVLCAACLELTRHPIERTTISVPSLLGAAFTPDLLGLALGVSAAVVVPLALGTWFRIIPPWMAGIERYVVIPASHALFLQLAYRKMFGRPDVGWGSAEAVGATWLRVVVASFLVTALTAVSLALCGMGIVFWGASMATLPVLVFEGKGPVAAMKESWRRSEERRFPLVLSGAVLLVPAIVATLFWMRVLGLVDPRQEAVAFAVVSLLLAPLWVLQIAAW